MRLGGPQPLRNYRAATLGRGGQDPMSLSHCVGERGVARQQARKLFINLDGVTNVKHAIFQMGWVRGCVLGRTFGPFVSVVVAPKFHQVCRIHILERAVRLCFADGGVHCMGGDAKCAQKDGRRQPPTGRWCWS